MNLEPSTSYYVRVQLSRPGEGGEGAPGPQATLETDCPGETCSLMLETTVTVDICIFIWQICPAINVHFPKHRTFSNLS